MSASNSYIYPAQDILTIISRAWNLLRANFKSSILFMLGPILLLTLLHLLASILSSQTFLTPTTDQTLMMTLTVVLLIIPLACLCFFFWVFSCCALSRFYYSAIVDEKPISIKSCWRYIGKIWLPLSVLLAVLFVILTGLIVLDFIILLTGTALAMYVLGALSTIGFNMHQLLPQIMMIFFLLVWGFVVFTVSISLISFQSFFFFFPLLSISTATEIQGAWWHYLSRAYRLLFENLPRMIIFSLALFCFSLIIMLVLMSPAWFWSILELSRLSTSQQHYIPFHIQTVTNLWGSLANLIVFPFHVSALTLFWYDCRVRKEGLDLQIWLNRILLRQGKQPEAYLPATTPQA